MTAAWGRRTIDHVARALSELLETLASVVDQDDARRESSRACAAEAVALAQRLPWVHRTGTPKGDWRLIFEHRRLRAGPAGTPYEQTLGIERAAYFFVGACAYPTGIVALLWAPLQALAGAFAPYDTGGLMAHLVPVDPSASWDPDARTKHLEAHLGHAADVAAFVGPYIAAHFRSPVTYVRAPRQSEPDFEVHHGLVNQGGSAPWLSWTVEAQIHADVDVTPDGLLLQEIWLDDLDLVDELPDDFKRMVRVPDGMPLEFGVARRIEESLVGASA